MHAPPFVLPEADQREVIALRTLLEQETYTPCCGSAEQSFCERLFDQCWAHRGGSSSTAIWFVLTPAGRQWAKEYFDSVPSPPSASECRTPPFRCPEGSAKRQREEAVLHTLHIHQRCEPEVGRVEHAFCVQLERARWARRARSGGFEITNYGWLQAEKYFHWPRILADQAKITTNIIAAFNTDEKDTNMVKHLYRLHAVFHPTDAQRAGADENLQDDKVVFGPEEGMFTSPGAARDHMVRGLDAAYAEVTDQIVFVTHGVEALHG